MHEVVVVDAAVVTVLFCVVIPATGSFAKGPSFTEMSVEATDQETLIAPQPPQTV